MSSVNGSVSSKVSMMIEGFTNCVCKSVNVIEKEGKKPLVFISLIDKDSFEVTGDMIYLNKEINITEITRLKSLEKKEVYAVIRLSEYNQRPSVAITSMIEAK